jgi:hypothetical protein
LEGLPSLCPSSSKCGEASETFSKGDVQVRTESPDPNVERSIDEFPGRRNDSSF